MSRKLIDSTTVCANSRRAFTRFDAVIVLLFGLGTWTACSDSDNHGTTRTDTGAATSDAGAGQDHSDVGNVNEDASAADAALGDTAGDDAAGNDAALNDATGDDAGTQDAVIDDASLEDASGAVPDGCTLLQITQLVARPGAPNGLVGEIDPELGSAVRDELSVEIYEQAGMTLAPGTFDLSQGIDQNYLSCNHCVLAFEDGSALGQPPARKFFQESGTLELTNVNSPPNGVSAGNLSNVKLIEVTIDNSFRSTPVPGGQCLFIQSASWNTEGAVGTPCVDATECGGGDLVCDPRTKMCASPQCGGASTCSSSDTCVPQRPNTAEGACYPGCTPFGATTCAANGECQPTNLDSSTGACFDVGAAQAEAACTSNDTNTGCVAGYSCVNDGAFLCREQCDFFGMTHACAAGAQSCSISNICTIRTQDPAAIGLPCAMASPDGTPCAVENGYLRGVCVAVAGGTVCRKWCRFTVPSDCGAPSQCLDTFLNGQAGTCSL